jgi:hypothetical protein
MQMCGGCVDSRGRVARPIPTQPSVGFHKRSWRTRVNDGGLGKERSRLGYDKVTRACTVVTRRCLRTLWWNPREVRCNESAAGGSTLKSSSQQRPRNYNMCARLRAPLLRFYYYYRFFFFNFTIIIIIFIIILFRQRWRGGGGKKTWSLICCFFHVINAAAVRLHGYVLLLLLLCSLLYIVHYLQQQSYSLLIPVHKYAHARAQLSDRSKDVWFIIIIIIISSPLPPPFIIMTSCVANTISGSRRACGDDS